MPTWPPDPLTISIAANIVLAVALIAVYFHHNGTLATIKADTTRLFDLHNTNATSIANVAAAPVSQEQMDAANKKALDARLTALPPWEQK